VLLLFAFALLKFSDSKQALLEVTEFQQSKSKQQQHCTTKQQFKGT